MRMASSTSKEIAVFTDTNLGTHIAVAVSPDIKAGDFKSKAIHKTLSLLSTSSIFHLYSLKSLLFEILLSWYCGLCSFVINLACFPHCKLEFRWIFSFFSFFLVVVIVVMFFKTVLSSLVLHIIDIHMITYSI